MCQFLDGVRKLARRKGLPKAGINCPPDFAAICDGAECCAWLAILDDEPVCPRDMGQIDRFVLGLERHEQMQNGGNRG
ncbi:hypothetical protein C4564_01395 [Candidatus Microgenomates bacterium]|nr:MAG: hypothetical protein C4564_01395 [Candidatus Microgenomates bacterium]